MMTVYELWQTRVLCCRHNTHFSRCLTSSLHRKPCLTPSLCHRLMTSCMEKMVRPLILVSTDSEKCWYCYQRSCVWSVSLSSFGSSHWWNVVRLWGLLSLKLADVYFPPRLRFVKVIHKSWWGTKSCFLNFSLILPWPFSNHDIVYCIG